MSKNIGPILVSLCSMDFVEMSIQASLSNTSNTSILAWRCWISLQFPWQISLASFSLKRVSVYTSLTGSLILDSYGKLVADTCKNRFDEAVKQKIQDYLHELDQRIEKKKESPNKAGTLSEIFWEWIYEHSWESRMETNDDMIAGQVNNQGGKLEKNILEKPKKRESVIKRLWEKQIAIAIKSGKPIPKYLYNQSERRCI